MHIGLRLLCVLVCGTALSGVAVAQRGYVWKGYNSRSIPGTTRHARSTATHNRYGKKTVHYGAHEGRSRVAHVARLQPARPSSTGSGGYGSAGILASGSGRNGGSQLTIGPAIKSGLNMGGGHGGLRAARRRQAPDDNNAAANVSDQKLQSELSRSSRGAQRNSTGTMPRSSSSHGANTGKRPSGYHPGSGNRSSGHH